MSLPIELSDPDLTDLVGRTLRAKARSVTAPEASRPFEPTLRLPTLSVPPVAPEPSFSAAPAPAAGDRGRRWPRWPLPVTAAVLVLVVGCAALVLSDDDGTQVQVGRPGPNEPDLEIRTTALGDPLVPQWVPEDLALTEGSWGTGEVFSDYGPMQLFLDGDQAGVAIEIGPSLPGTILGDEFVTVRGTEGSVTHSNRADLRVHWQEDASLTATVRGLSQDEALAFLDSLTWRSDDHAAGFAPPSGRALSLVGENLDARPATHVYLTYSNPTGRTLTLRSLAGTGRPSSSYLIGWLLDGRRDDGTVGLFDPDVAGEIELRWPDGNSLDLRGTGLSRDEMRRVVASLAPAGPDALAQLETQSSSHLAELPLIAEATLPSGTVQRREAGDEHAACLRLGDAEPVCPNFSYLPTWFDVSDSVVANFALDGTWYVIAVASQPVTIAGGDPLSLMPGTPVPGETTFDGTYHYLLARPDPSLPTVVIGQAGLGSMGLSRPLGVDTG